MAITARGNLNGHDLTDIPVLNPGDWFGKAWLIEIGGSYTPLFLIVEGDTISDVIDELAEHEKYGHNIVVADDDLGDYPEDDRHYSGTGQVIDLDHLMVHGQEGANCPFSCRYHGDGLSEEGVVPTEFEHEEVE
jgi:predicted small metal-binding protein